MRMDDGGTHRRRIIVSACFREGWGLLRGRYWLFLGIVVVGHLLGSLAPMGILMGPMLAGIFLCFLRAEGGGPVAFGDLFKGFDLFVEGLVAWLVFLGCSALATLPFVAVFIWPVVVAAEFAAYRRLFDVYAPPPPPPAVAASYERPC